MAAIVEGEYFPVPGLLALDGLVYYVLDAVSGLGCWDDPFCLGEGSCGLEYFVLVIGYRVHVAFVDEVG